MEFVSHILSMQKGLVSYKEFHSHKTSYPGIHFSLKNLTVKGHCKHYNDIDLQTLVPESL